jgi:hypothetical protein
MQLMDLQLKELDHLGMLMAQIADLNEQAEVIKNNFKNAGEGKYEGNLYKATVTLSQRDVVDYKAIMAELAVDPALIAKFTKQTASIAIRVTARSK